MVFYFLEGIHSLLHFPVAPVGLNAVRSSLLDNLINRQLWPVSSPFISFETVFDPGHGCHPFKKPLEEQDHLLVFMHVYFSVVIKDVKANSDDDVNVRWLEHQEVFVLVLEYKLVDKWIFL